MTEIMVSTEDLRPGDVILKCINATGAVFPWGNEVVLAVHHFWFDLRTESGSEHRVHFNGNFRFVVRRPHGSAQTKGGIEEFPHTCTRCGMAAYVGIFEVAHKDEEAAKSCPARRK